MPIFNTLTLQGANGRKIAADIQVDLGRNMLVAIVREVPIEVEAPDVAGLRAALEARATELFALPPKPAPARRQGRPSKGAGVLADAADDPAKTTPDGESNGVGVGAMATVSLLTSSPDTLQQAVETIKEFTAKRSFDVQCRQPVVPRAAIAEAHFVLAIGALPRSDVAQSMMDSLLPGARDLLSPAPGWNAWKQPANENALDVEVENLVKSGRITGGGDCPYWRARAAVIHAVDAAEEASESYLAARVDGAAKRTSLRNLATNAARTRKAFEEFGAEFEKSWATLWESWRDATGEGRRENRAGERALIVPGLRDRLAAVVPDLTVVEEIAREVGEAVGNSEADFGKRAFVRRMLTAYHNLVAVPKGDQPINFVDAAAEVAGLRMRDGVSWRATTKKILAEANFIALRTPSDRD